MSWVAVLDVGTRNVKALVFDEGGSLVSEAKRSVNFYTPRPGFVELDPGEVVDACVSAYAEAVEKFGRVDGLGITNHRASVVLWNRDGRPLSRIVTWLDVRGHEVVKRLKQETSVAELYRPLLNPNASSMYLLWLFEELGLKERARRGEVLYGTVDSFIVYSLTRGKTHATDPSNASCTGLFNPVTLEWWKDFADAVNIPLEGLPEVRNTIDDFGVAENLPEGPQIFCVMADQQSALFGEACFEQGDIKMTHGSGSFVDVNAGPEFMMTGHPSLIPLVGWKIGQKTSYMLEGYIHFSGELLVWLSELGVVSGADEADSLAAGVEDSGGVYVVPAFSGMTFPDNDPSARGAVIGLTRAAGRAHMARACIESVAFLSYEIVKTIKESTGITIRRIACDGGMSRSNVLLQLIADLCDVDVERPVTLDATGLGAFYAVALKTGLLDSMESIKKLRKVGTVFHPSGPEVKDKVAKRYERWRKAVERAKSWEE